MQYPSTIETARLLLRPWRAADAAALYALAQDERVGPAAGRAALTSEAEGAAAIGSLFSAPGTWAITPRGDDTPIGGIALRPATAAAARGEPELGCWLGVPFWGNGYAPEAARALLRLAFDELGLARVWCSHSAENHQSRRVIRKCGFLFQFAQSERVPPRGETREVWYYCAFADRHAPETGGVPDGALPHPSSRR